jgi:O-glycosyl hydrolase
MASNGAIIDIVSIQNEPDWQVTYESCDYTANDFVQFFKAPGEIIGAKVAAPESLNFNQTMTNAILSDDIAANSIDIVAGHIYGGGTAKLPLAEQKNKEIWMTEYLLNLNTGNAGAAAWSTYSESAKWTESITMLKSIHDSMMVNWNAYVWWYLQRYYSFIGDGEQGTVNGEVTKRGIGFSHFSKFVRPGYKRVEAIENPRSGIYVSAYTGEGKTIINAINISGSAVSQQFSIEGTSATSVIPYVTSETLSMQKQASITIIPEIDGFNISLPAKSITTFITD